MMTLSITCLLACDEVCYEIAIIPMYFLISLHGSSVFWTPASDQLMGSFLTLLECLNILSCSPLHLVHLNCLRFCPVVI